MTHARLTWDPLISVSVVPLANRVLQCPVAVSTSPQGMKLLVGSRDQDNRGRILSLTLESVSAGEWAVVQSSVLLAAQDIAADCLGLVPGDLATLGDKRVVFGNAYFSRRGRLLSSLFSATIEGESWNAKPEAVVIAPISGFRAAPALVHGPEKSRLVFSEGRPSSRGGFPVEYGLRSVPFGPSVDVLVSSNSVLPACGVARAVTRFTQDLDGEQRGWFCHRYADRGGYQLGRCLLDSEGVANKVWWEDNGGLGETPVELVMLSYPEALPDGRLLASAGRFGDQGLVVLDTRFLEW